MKKMRVTGVVMVLVWTLSLGVLAASKHIRNLQPFRDSSGYIATYNTAGDIDETNAFFQELGTNGRTCASCHRADQAFSVSAEQVRSLFAATGGKDPLFAPFDGANCPTAKDGDAAARSLLLQHGLIRVGITLPANPEFEIRTVYDPFGCAVSTDPATGRPTISVYRRPLPTTNLRFLSTVMFDGRETLQPLNNEQTFPDNLVADLSHQAMDATLIHAQAAVTPTQSNCRKS